MHSRYVFRSLVAFIAALALGIGSLSAQITGGGTTGGGITGGGLTGGGLGGGLGGGGLGGGGLGGGGLGGLGGGGQLGQPGFQQQAGFGLAPGQTGTDTGAGTSTYGQGTGLQPYYGNPFALGAPSGTAAAFGNPAFNGSGGTAAGGRGGATANVARGGAATGRGGVAGVRTGATGAAGNTGFASSAGTRRALPYRTTVMIPYQRQPIANSTPQLRAVFTGSNLTPGSAVNVAVQGNTVVLTGSVSTDRERRLAEAMLRLTPGVRRVQNDLTPRIRP